LRGWILPIILGIYLIYTSISIGGLSIILEPDVYKIVYVPTKELKITVASQSIQNYTIIIKDLNGKLIKKVDIRTSYYIFQKPLTLDKEGIYMFTLLIENINQTQSQRPITMISSTRTIFIEESRLIISAILITTSIIIRYKHYKKTSKTRPSNKEE
jgi:hypothetical protein